MSPKSRHLLQPRIHTDRYTDKSILITMGLIAHELHEYSRILLSCRAAARQKFLAPPFYLAQPLAANKREQAVVGIPFTLPKNALIFGRLCFHPEEENNRVICAPGRLCKLRRHPVGFGETGGFSQRLVIFSG